MVNGDIHFILTGTYRREVLNGVEAYFFDSFIVNPTFIVSVHGQGRVVLSCTLLKNGFPYTDAEVAPTDLNEYRVVDPVVLRAGNFSYGVRVAMNDGGVYERHFFIKIAQGVDSTRVKFTSLTAYGLLENFTPVRVMAVVAATDPVDRVKLQRRVDWGRWVDLGEMRLTGEVYTYDDAQFFPNMTTPVRVVYRATVRVATGHTHGRDLLVVINPNSLSLNTVDVAYVDKVNTLRGGVVGRVTADGDWRGALVRVVADLSDAPTPARTVHLRITKDDRTVDVHAEGFAATFPQFFNPNHTDVAPNLYVVDASCAVTLRQAERTVVDTARLHLSLSCGESVVTEFTLTPDNYAELTMASGRMDNSVVEYTTGGASVALLDGVREDSSAAVAGTTTGFLTVANGQVDFVNSVDWSMNTVTAARVDDMLTRAHWLTFTDDRLTGYMAAVDGVTVWTFDGLNFAEVVARVNLRAATVEAFANGCCPIRHTSSDDLELMILDHNGVDELRWITMLNDAVTVEDLSFQLTSLYRGLDARLTYMVETLGTVEDDVLAYDLTLNGVDAEPVHSFRPMGLTNEQQGFTMLMLRVVQSFPVTLGTVNPTTGGRVTVDGRLTATLNAAVRVGRLATEVESVRLRVDVQAGAVSLTMDDHTPNQLPPNIMERTNDTFFVKFERGRTSTEVEDYGRYLHCLIYENTAKLCTVPLTAVYGPGCVETVFRYSDAASLRVIHRGSVAWLINVRADRTLISRVDVLEDELIDVHQLDTNVVFTNFLRRGEAYLDDLVRMFAGDGHAAFVERTMRLISVSDQPKQLYVYSLLDDPIEMERMDNRVCSDNESAVTWFTNVAVDWPLSIKSRQTMLVHPVVTTKRRQVH